MKVFASWSGGKDCMLALHRQLKIKEIEVVSLVNMLDTTNKYSRSHRIKKELIKSQAEAMQMPILQKAVDSRGYEANFKEAITNLKKEGVTAGIFGDIYLEEHRKWIERVCSDLDITPLFPLWNSETNAILKEFIDVGFKALTVAINTEKLAKNWLGKTLDSNFYKEIIQLENIDSCGEGGEYHSFVYDGPLFSKAVSFSKGETIEETKNSFLQLIRK